MSCMPQGLVAGQLLTRVRILAQSQSFDHLPEPRMDSPFARHVLTVSTLTTNTRWLLLNSFNAPMLQGRGRGKCRWNELVTFR